MADAKKPEDKKDPWLNWLALTTVIFAVCATLSTFKGGGYSTRSVISQAQASDQWAYYQAKSIKANLYQIQRERLQLEFDTLPADAASMQKDRTMNLKSPFITASLFIASYKSFP